MKKQLLKLAVFSAAVVISASSFGQWEQKTAEFNAYTGDAPVIDGAVDDVWAEVDAHAIEVPFGTETVSFGSNGATFKATWDLENIYVLIEVDDDNHYNHIDAGVESWQADKPEVYFDVNEVLVDSVGPSAGGSGHYQFAPSFDASEDDADGSETAFFVEPTGPYVYEYAISFASLVHEDTTMTLMPVEDEVFGFDVTILDLDETGAGGNETMGRINWSNNTTDVVDGGAAGESWVTMDQAGVVTLKGTGKEVGDGTAISNTSVNSNMVYPNVASDMIVVNADAAQYEVINSLGQVVMVSLTNEFSVASLETGVYFIKADNQVARILKK